MSTNSAATPHISFLARPKHHFATVLRRTMRFRTFALISIGALGLSVPSVMAGDGAAASIRAKVDDDVGHEVKDNDELRLLKGHKHSD